MTLMRVSLLRNSRAFIAIFLIAAMFVVTTACGGSSDSGSPADAAEDLFTAAPTVAPTSPDTPQATEPAAEPTEPPLINTPGPVSNTAPDFTLPSVQGTDFTLSQFQGEKPVAVVFYRGYW